MEFPFTAQEKQEFLDLIQEETLQLEEVLYQQKLYKAYKVTEDKILETEKFITNLKRFHVWLQGLEPKL